MFGRLLKTAAEFSVSLQQAIPEVPPSDLKPFMIAQYAPFEAQLPTQVRKEDMPYPAKQQSCQLTEVSGVSPLMHKLYISAQRSVIAALQRQVSDRPL